jgi:hypothetical protein
LAHDPDPANAMAQLGHTDPAFTIRVYTHLMRRSPEERESMKALIDGTWELEKAPNGTRYVRGSSELDSAERKRRGCEPHCQAVNGERARQDSNL